MNSMGNPSPISIFRCFYREQEGYLAEEWEKVLTKLFGKDFYPVFKEECVTPTGKINKLPPSKKVALGLAP